MAVNQLFPTHICVSTSSVEETLKKIDVRIFKKVLEPYLEKIKILVNENIVSETHFRSENFVFHRIPEPSAAELA